MEQFMYGVIYGVVGERLSFDRPHTEPPTRGGTLSSMLTELSARGWQLVSTTASGERVVCILRKSIQGPASPAAPAAPPAFAG